MDWLNVRKQRSAWVEDIFSAGIWLASAPLHEAGKTTKSGNTLKAGIRREELGFASDTPSSDPNACPLISTFSKPHSEVASTTHIPALKGFRKRRFSVFWFTQDGRSPQTNAAFKNAARRELSWQKTTAPQPAKTYNNRRTFPPKDKTTLAGRNLLQERHSLLGQIERLLLSRKSTALSVC